MEFLKNILKDEERIVGLCGFKETQNLKVFIPKTRPQNFNYSVNYKKNFFLM